MKYYPCELSPLKHCKFGGNKYYNYGFFQGTAGYCRKIKKWLSDIKQCPINVPNIEGAK